MYSHPHSPPASVLVTGSSPPGPLATVCPLVAAAKARAKVLKKWRKRERLRFFSAWCAGLHTLGFSF